MAEPTNMKLRIDESKMGTTYANGFRHHANDQEVIIDFGVSIPVQHQGEQQMSFTVDNRLVMNYVTAKRLAGLMNQVIQAYEQRNGEIPTGQQG